MSEYKFQPGDRVEYVGSVDRLKGKIGTCIGYSNIVDSIFALVKFDDDYRKAVCVRKDSIILYNGDCTEETEQIEFDNYYLENYLKEMFI